MTRLDPRPITTSPPAPTAIGAAIDVGSNSVHLLVATTDGDGALRPDVDASAFLGVGRAVAQAGEIGREVCDRLADTLGEYLGAARRAGADGAVVVATEPFRRAADAAAVVDLLRERTGVEVLVVSHEEEALLTAIGVTGGRPVTAETLVVDLGGGSAELCFLHPADPPRAIGVRLGAVQLHDRHADGDPSSADALAAMRDEAREAWSAVPDEHPGAIVAVGGTVTNLGRLVRPVPGETLTRDDLAAALAEMAAAPSAEVARRHGVRPERATVLPVGAIIADTLLARFGARELTVSDAGIREGAILARAVAGSAWRDRLPQLATGWRSPVPG